MRPLPSTDLIAFDIGGANIKAADGAGWAHVEPFAMWRDWRRLSDALLPFVAEATHHVVATMTGEIADCFPSRRAGVEHIVTALSAAAGTTPVGVYATDGRIVSPREAVADPLTVAASNWHAVARLAATLAPTPRTLLVDIGSTTTDIIPIYDGRPVPLATTDVGRMTSGELVYTGIERTPVAAIVRSLPHRGIQRPVAGELFARSQDAWLTLGGLPEDPASTDTADGGPATRDAARIRLARMMLLDPENFRMSDAVAAANWITRAQARRVAGAIRRVVERAGWEPTSIVISGHGGELARQALANVAHTLLTVELQNLASPIVARVAPAHALALIARGTLP